MFFPQLLGPKMSCCCHFLGDVFLFILTPRGFKSSLFSLSFKKCTNCNSIYTKFFILSHIILVQFWFIELKAMLRVTFCRFLMAPVPRVKELKNTLKNIGSKSYKKAFTPRKHFGIITNHQD